MNSKILVPKVQIGAISIKNFTGGEIDIEKISSEVTVKTCPTEYLAKIPSHELRREMEDCKKELNSLPKSYSIINGVVKRNINVNQKRILELRERIKVGYIILNRRKSRIHERIFRTRRITTSLNESLEYEIMRFNPSMIRKPTYEMKNGDKMKKNQIHNDSFVDEFGEFHERIYKDCIVPYTKVRSLRPRDILILHRSGRLCIDMKEGVKTTLSFKGIPEDEDAIEMALQTALKAGRQLFVALPVGGRKDKKYGEFPMPSSDYYLNTNKVVPLDEITIKVYKPEIDGKNPKAKEVINEYRGTNKGYAPVYTYDEVGHIRDFVPELLSYNHMEYSDKCIVLLGTKNRIKFIDERIKTNNHFKNDFYNFIKGQKIIGYNGQTSRCTNKRIVVDEDGKVQVFGLNVKGTPEENLKGYLRSFDKVKEHLNEEALELLEVADAQDGRQTIDNLEHDLRFELKYLKNKSSSELYYLIMGVEEEITNLPREVTYLSTLEGYVEEFGRSLYIQRLNSLRMKVGSKKETALLRVLQSFKSTKEIEEEEGKGLTDDLKDLVSIEEKATDSSYKKSKNLFSQQLGILNRNQNPLNMEGEITLLEDKKWRMKGGPISFPTNEKLPKRNIPFVQRKKEVKTIEYEATMFSRNIDVSIRTRCVKTKMGWKSIPIGIRVKSERESLFSSSIERTKINPNWVGFVLDHPVWLNYLESLKPSKVKEEVVETKILIKLLEERFEECKKEAMKCNDKNAQERFDKETKIFLPENRLQAKVFNFPVELPGKKYRVKTSCWRVSCQIGSMYPKHLRYTVKEFQHVPRREILRKRRGRKSTWDKYQENKGRISTVNIFDERNRSILFDKETPCTEVWKKVSWKQFQASEQKAYQFSGRIVFDEKKHEFVRIPHTSSPSFKVLHTIGNEKGEIDHYIIDIDGKRLYAKGDLSILNKESISFTGTRKPTKQTPEFVKQTVKMFLEDDDYVTVAGGAEGCDTIVHRTTLHNKGKTIIVLAGGFNGQYVKTNQIKHKHVLDNGGLILSEHPPEYVPTGKDFVLRNKVIAALSDRLVVFEGRTGTTHCANFGAQMGKEVLVQPGTRNSAKIISSTKGRPFFPIEGYYPF